MVRGKRVASFVVVVLLAAAVFGGCAQEPQVVVETRQVPVTVEVPVTVIVQAPTLEPLPTYTLYPTYTPVPEPTATSTPAATATPEFALTAEELEEQLAAQPLAVVRTEYIVQSADYKTLYPDMLSAVVRNNGEEDIRDLVVAFAAWDDNGLPILIKGNIDFSDGAYYRQAEATGINLVPGDEWGQGSGYSIEDGLNIDSFVAVVVSYTSFDGEEWDNPYFAEWKAMYAGARRPD